MWRKDNKEPKTISVPDVTNVTNVTIILRCVPKLEDFPVSTLYLTSYEDSSYNILRGRVNGVLEFRQVIKFTPFRC